LAKGVRRPTSRKRGHLEVFSYIRFQAARGKGMDIMTEAETIDNFSKIRENLKRASLAYYFMEVVGRTTHENETHREVFEYVLESMERLKEEKQLKKFRLGFVRRLVSLLGFWPEGKLLLDPDGFLEGVIERKLVTSRVGKRVLAWYNQEYGHHGKDNLACQKAGFYLSRQRNLRRFCGFLGLRTSRD